MLAQTKKVLDVLSTDNLFIKNDIRFVGGTALSYHINHRLSEDLDFATLKINLGEIEEVMQSYKAEKIEHSNIIKDAAKNDGFDIDDSYIKYMLNGVKVEFFTPPFNLLELDIWNKDNFSFYENTRLRVMSLNGIVYMKTMAFWNRKKYRDIFDIYYILKHDLYSPKEFLDNYLKYNITYSKKDLLEKIKSKDEFYEKLSDEGINTLVENPMTYEWYRSKIENFIHQEYLADLYK